MSQPFLNMAGSDDNPEAEIASVNNNGVCIDELLCFIVNKMLLLPPDTITQLCVTSFGEEDIVASKKRLFDQCADVNNTRFAERKGPKKNVQNIEDILKLLHEKGTDIPTSKLPPITFDSINVSTLLSSIRRTQDEINVLKECISSQNAVCDGLKESVSGVTTRLHTVERAHDTVLKEGVTVSSQNAVCDGLKESVHVSGVTTRLQTVSRAQDTVLKEGVTANLQNMD